MYRGSRGTPSDADGCDVTHVNCTLHIRTPYPSGIQPRPQTPERGKARVFPTVALGGAPPTMHCACVSRL
ncbi:hypothetical protein QC761_0102340 [Podospora bellae-mahoneyi]|uniref:Uncharacterized protein n=1 Tax=Podospora bellae-mahoneyi TaxID=2093777 RepID=A0ABR0F6A8_9PEZI|nr:hypothetical protein QC761_0102340 [Podospora bellae-mahoneyi]